MSGLVLYLMAVQVGLPLILIVANTFIPTKSVLGLTLRSVSIGVLILYTAFASVWLFPPRWTPYVLLVLLVLSSWVAFRRFRRNDRNTGRFGIGAEFVLALIVLAGGAWLFLPALSGRNVPDGAIDLSMPLGAGTYQVLSGGATQAINTHLQTLTLERAKNYRGQSYALDIIGIDGLGFHAEGIAPTDPERYRIFGADILAPCTGEIVFAIDGLPDMQVPEGDRDNMLGNGVIIACDGKFVVLAHMTTDSLMVDVGDTVTTGQLIGRVGNSGNSNEPHLHIHVQDGMPPDAPFSGEPVWFTVEGEFLVRNDVVSVAAVGGAE